MNKAILVVSFGTTYKNTREKTIYKIEEKIKNKFKDYDIKRAFTSNMIISILKERDGVNVDTPKEALLRLKKDGYKDVIIQPLHMIPGEEYEYIKNTALEFKDQFNSLKMGRPVLYYKGYNKKNIDDYEVLVDSIKEIISKNGTTILMGHGSTHFSNACYSCLQLVFLDKGYKNVFVANVEGYPYINNAVKHMKNLDNKNVKLAPLMIVAGDHAVNDMASDKEGSFKSILEKNNFKVEAYIHGLGEIEKFQEIYIKHIEDVINLQDDMLKK